MKYFRLSNPKYRRNPIILSDIVEGVLGVILMIAGIYLIVLIAALLA